MLREWFQRYRVIGFPAFLGGVRPEIWHILFVLLAVPMQFLLSYHLSIVFDPNASVEERLSSRMLSDHFTTVLSFELWRQLYRQRVKLGLVELSPKQLYLDSGDPNGECPAMEVMKFQNPQGHFTMSYLPRNDRNGVLFIVGNMVQHKIHGYRGVIVGWDPHARAPKNWLRAKYSSDEMASAKSLWQPYYAVLVDIRDRSPPQMVYVGQNRLLRHYAHLTSIHNHNHSDFDYIRHPVINDYFAYFDGLNYVPRPWLKALYPKD